MEQIDLVAHRELTKQLIARLKSEIGKHYADFKAQSLAYQRGNIDVSQYYQSAVNLVNNEETLRQAFDLLPDPEKRAAVLKVWASQQHMTPSNTKEI